MRVNFFISALALAALLCTSACKKQYRQYKCACTQVEGSTEVVEYTFEAETIVDANSNCKDIEVKVSSSKPEGNVSCKLN